MSIELIPLSYILYFMLYGGVTLVSVIACFYLLFREGNAFAVDVTPPVRLRRWVMAFFAVSFLSHVWWLMFYLFSPDTSPARYVVIVVLDSVTLFPTVAGTLIYMLQDYKRPIWPVYAAMLPSVVLGALQFLNSGDNYLTIQAVYVLAFYVLLIGYMQFAVRKYGRWLRDNYADLEHKEVWKTQVSVMVSLLVFILYWVDGGIIFAYLLQITVLWLIGVLLWRVETLPLLEEGPFVPQPAGNGREISLETFAQIERLLTEHCVTRQLYLQRDLTLSQLAQAVGTNRLYLSQYFSSQGNSYNAYINDLRIDHFVSLYREATDARRPFTLQQLANDSGYRSYSTFSLAFRQRMGQSVKSWMHNISVNQSTVRISK